MKYYVLRYNINTRKLEYYNIFDNIKLLKGIEKIKSIKSHKDFIEELDSLLKYCFMSKAEYEILAQDIFEKQEKQKIDVYYQLKPNIDIIANIINHNV